MHPGCYPAQSLRSRLRLRIAGFAIWGITLSDGIPRWQAMQIRKRKRERRGCAGKQNPALSDHTDEQPHTCSCVCGDFRSKSLKMHGISVFGVFVTLFPLSTRGLAVFYDQIEYYSVLTYFTTKTVMRAFSRVDSGNKVTQLISHLRCNSAHFRQIS